MNVKTAGLALIALIVFAGVVYAATTLYSGHQHGDVIEEGVAIVFNEVTIEDGGIMEWGTLILGEPKSLTLTVTNNFETTREVAFLSPELPTEWTQEWTPDETLLLPGETATGILTLTATTLGEFTIAWQITATEP